MDFRTLVDAWQAGTLSRRAFLERAGALGVGAAAAALLEGRSARPAAAQTTQKRELVVAQGGDVSKLDPHFSTSSNDIRVTFNVFDNLTNRHPDGTLQPGLATEWKATAPTTWTFKLRQGVKFHNGDPCTAADVKFSIERTYDPTVKTLVSSVFTTISRIETPDHGTVVFHTKASDPLLPARLAFYGGQIVPKKHLEQVGNDTFNAKPIGTGPVRFVSWAKDDKLVLEANPDYWGGRIDVDRVVVRPVPEIAPRVAGLLKGETDLITQLTPDHWDRINQNATTKGASALYAGLYVLGTNSKVPPLNNWTLKKAMQLGVDREAIVKELWRGRGIIPTGPIAKGDAHFDTTLPPLAYDPKKARELVKQSGYKGEPIYLETTVGLLANDKAMSEAIAPMWKDIGINVVVEVIEFSVRAQKNRERTFKGLWWSDPTSTLQDPDGMMYRLLAPGGIMDYWREAEWDRLGEQARFSLDPNVREAAYKRMQEIMDVYYPWLPVIVPIESHGVASYVNWRSNPNQTMELRKEVFSFNR